MSYSLNSSKVVIIKDYLGESYKGYQGVYWEFRLKGVQPACLQPKTLRLELFRA